MVVDIADSNSSTYYHEFSHIIDSYLECDANQRDDALFSESVWKSFNPSWFEGYTYDYAVERELKENGYFERKRQEQARYWMYETINEKLRNHFYNNPDVASLLNDKEQRVLNNQQSSFTAARDVLDFYFKTLTGK